MPEHHSLTLIFSSPNCNMPCYACITLKDEFNNPLIDQSTIQLCTPTMMQDVLRNDNAAEYSLHNMENVFWKHGSVNSFTIKTFESLHKKWIKIPYRISNQYNTTLQMLNTTRRQSIIDYLTQFSNTTILAPEALEAFEQFLPTLDKFFDLITSIECDSMFDNISINMDSNEIGEYTTYDGLCFGKVLMLCLVKISSFDEAFGLGLEDKVELTYLTFLFFSNRKKQSLNLLMEEIPTIEKRNAYDIFENWKCSFCKQHDELFDHVWICESHAQEMDGIIRKVKKFLEETCNSLLIEAEKDPIVDDELINKMTFWDQNFWIDRCTRQKAKERRLNINLKKIKENYNVN
ncbi:hypothetical protein C1646_772326 [Rhizophagus diaphanus]|nr:hypothetical protein C1646_772326 [Rhizophagus diaphanus] [Rhizophagus sp. MUCL 43196]